MGKGQKVREIDQQTYDFCRAKILDEWTMEQVYTHLKISKTTLRNRLSKFNVTWTDLNSEVMATLGKDQGHKGDPSSKRKTKVDIDDIDEIIN